MRIVVRYLGDHLMQQYVVVKLQRSFSVFCSRQVQILETEFCTSKWKCGLQLNVDSAL